MKVAILPGRIALPTRPQQRRHHPQRGTHKREWTTFQSCLRWDFGFTCPFCLLHESDLSEHGSAGEGLIWIEHYYPRSTDESKSNSYDNTLFSCRFCNNSRGDRYPVVDNNGRILLDPTRVAWNDHFQWIGDAQLRPKPDDVNAEYTWIAYQLDHPKKLERRRFRRRIIESSCSLIQKLPLLIKKLDNEAKDARKEGDILKARQKLADKREWQHTLITAAEQIQRFRSIPKDAPQRCRCGKGATMSLPAWIAEQLIELELPDIG